MATSLKTQLASKGIKITIKNKTTGEQMKLAFPKGVNAIPIHLTMDSYSIYGQAVLLEHPTARVGDPDLMLVFVDDKGEGRTNEVVPPVKDDPPKPEVVPPAPEEPKKPTPEETPLPDPVVSIPVEKPISSTTSVAPAAPKFTGRKNR